MDPAALVEQVLVDHLSTTAATPAIDAKIAETIAWLDKRLAEEATDDPEEIRKAEEEVTELKRNLNANRAATGERQVFG